MNNKKASRIFLFIWLGGVASMCLLAFASAIYKYQTIPGFKFSEVIKGFQAPIEISEAVICEGPKENGEPTEERTSFSSNELDKIFTCFKVDSDHVADLTAFWLHDEGNRIILTTYNFRVNNKGYVYISLSDSIKTTNYIRYLEDEIEAGYLPEGNYSILIKQNRTKKIQIHFTIEK